MPLDADIAAADPATLEKIKAQDYRNYLSAATEREATRLASYQADVASMTKFRSDQMKLQQDQAALLPVSEPELTLRQQLGLAIADKYMTTSTSTVPATVLADAVNDAARLKAAIDEALKALAP